MFGWSKLQEEVRRVARREVERVLKLQLQPRMGNVVEWDPKTHRAKVELQPEGVTTNWIPVESPWIGNGWGLVAAPSVGDQVKVTFPEYGSNQGVIVGRVFDQRNPPPQVDLKEGEFLLVDKEGSWLALNPSTGKLRMNGQSEVNTQSPQKVTSQVGGNKVVVDTSGIHLN